MKQTSKIISTYSADVFGVCSALFELGGMTVMHDASGCNSTYTTHDEPRWYDMESMVYISGLSELEAIMGDDEKLIGDIVAAAQELKPRFIALAGTPIPAMTGFDYEAAAMVIEERTGIPAFGFATTGMATYVQGASMALAAFARHFPEDVSKTADRTVNILGLTPLDFSVNGTDKSIADWLQSRGWRVLSRWAMGSDLEELKQAGGAHINLVVSAAGLEAAKVLERRFGTPYVVGVPYGKDWSDALGDALELTEEIGLGMQPHSEPEGGGIVVIGEGVTAVSLASAIEMATDRGVRVLCPTDCPAEVLRPKDRLCRFEEELEQALLGAEIVIADPLMEPICPKNARFVALPTEAFSGRIYREKIPNLVTGFDRFLKEAIL